MIKYILGSLLLVSTALANDLDFYGKIGAGMNTIAPLKIQTNNINGKIKLKNKFPVIEIGGGIQLSESIRSEIMFDYYFMFCSKETSLNSFGDEFAINYQTKISNLSFDAYKDVITVNGFTPFIGGGIGISHLHDKATGIGKNISQNISQILQPVSSQQVYRFSYKLTAGIDIKLTENSSLDISYNYLNLGHNKPRVLDGVNNMEARDYLVHNIIVSTRFNF